MTRDLFMGAMSHSGHKGLDLLGTPQHPDVAAHEQEVVPGPGDWFTQVHGINGQHDDPVHFQCPQIPQHLLHDPANAHHILQNRQLGLTLPQDVQDLEEWFRCFLVEQAR